MCFRCYSAVGFTSCHMSMVCRGQTSVDEQVTKPKKHPPKWDLKGGCSPAAPLGSVERIFPCDLQLWPVSSSLSAALRHTVAHQISLSFSLSLLHMHKHTYISFLPPLPLFPSPSSLSCPFLILALSSWLTVSAYHTLVLSGLRLLLLLFIINSCLSRDTTEGLHFSVLVFWLRHTAVILKLWIELWARHWIPGM